jgi:hypothetical protein
VTDNSQGGFRRVRNPALSVLYVLVMVVVVVGVDVLFSRAKHGFGSGSHQMSASSSSLERSISGFSGSSPWVVARRSCVMRDAVPDLVR